MMKFLMWIERIGYNREEVYDNANLLKVLLDEYADLELFHLDQVEKSRNKSWV